MTPATPTTPDQMHAGVHAGSTAIDTKPVAAADHAPSATAASAGVAPAGAPPDAAEGAPATPPPAPAARATPTAATPAAPAPAAPAPFADGEEAPAPAAAGAPEEEAQQAMQKIETVVAQAAGKDAPEAVGQLRAKAADSSYIEGTGAFCRMGKDGGEFYGLNKSGEFASLPFKGSDAETMEKKFGVFQAARGYPSGTAALPSRFETGTQSLTPGANAAALLEKEPAPKFEMVTSFPAPPDETKSPQGPEIERDRPGGGYGGYGG